MASGEAPAGLVLARNEANRRLLGTVLEEAGLRVNERETPDRVVQETGKDALPALALVDIDGFSDDVWEACRGLCEGDVPVVVIAGSRTDEVQEATLSLGVRTVLEKPLREANLQALVRTIL